MNRTPRPIDVTHAVLGLLLCIACASATAGEPHEPMPTNPTLYYVCMTVVGNVEYDTAAFATKNPGPAFVDHQKHVYAIQHAFEAYLQQKYGYNGYVQCTRPNTLAEAKKWLEWRTSESEQPGKNYQLVQTDWTYSGGSGASASAVAPATPAAQSAPADSGPPTGYWACANVVNRVQYESAVYEGPNDAVRQRRALFGFSAYMGEKHPTLVGRGTCDWRPTRAAAEAWLAQFGAGIIGGVTQRVPTGWSPSNGSTAATPSQTTTTQVATATPTPTKPAPPPVIAPKPSVPPPVAAPVAPKPSVPATSAAPKGVFVTCKAEDLASGQRLYNPPVQVTGGDYAAWQASYSKFVKTNYKFDRDVGCNKLPTLAEAQGYFKEITDTAKLTTQINGRPSPVIITNWKYP